MFWMLCLLVLSGPEGVAERYRAHVQFLADDLLEGRETSFRGQRLAARYVATQLALAGAQGFYPDSANPYYQPFWVSAKGVDQSSVALTLKERGKSHRFENGLDFRFRSFSAGNFQGNAPMVFVGYGFETEAFNEYATVDVEGKWVVVFEGQPEGREGSLFESPQPGARLFSKIVAARTKKALGVVILQKGEIEAPAGAGPNFRLRLATEKEEESNENKVFPFVYIAEAKWQQLLGRDYEKVLNATAVIAEKEAPQSFNLRKKTLSLQFGLQEEDRETENVVAFLPGSDPQLAQEYVVISAHYDHVGVHNGTVYNGADDNASGTATLLMLARDLASIKHRRSLIVLLVSAEESGLLGSEYFVANPPVPIDAIVANINMDMIGRNKVGEIGVIPSEVKGISSLNQLLEDINATSRYSHTLLKDMDRYHKRSDHYNFTKSDIPALFFFAGVHEDYHGPNDDWQDLDYQKLSYLYGLMQEFLVACLNTDQKPFFLEVPEEKEKANSED